MTSMIGIIDMDTMDGVWPMTPEEQQKFLSSLEAHADPDDLRRFMLGVTLDAHACGYNCCIEDTMEN